MSLNQYFWTDEIWLIVTNDYYKARRIIQEQIDELAKLKIFFEEHIVSQYDSLTKFSNGLKIYWTPPHDISIDCRINKLWVDNNIDKNLVETIYEPMLIGDKDIIWI